MVAAMSAPQQKPLIRLIDAIRVGSGLMRSIAGRTHKDLGVSPAQCAVLDILLRNGPQTVPDIARMRDVSRQNVQKIVDALSERGLTASGPNPAHKRSPVIGLSAHGKQMLAAVAQREKAILETLQAGLDEAGIAAAARTLEALTEALRRLDQAG